MLTNNFHEYLTQTLATVHVPGETHVYFGADSQCAASPPPFSVFMHSDPAGHCLTPSLCKILPF